MTVVQLREAAPAQNIAATLRRIADDLESGKHGLITTAVLCLGHTTDQPPKDGETAHGCEHAIFGLGPRVDIFTVRGLLATCLKEF
jgi:hypothetical protein